MAPHLDTNVIDTMTAGSADHDRLRELLQQPGQLTLRSRLLLPGNKVTLRLEASGEFTLKCGDVAATSALSGAKHFSECTVEAKQPRQDNDARGGREQVLPSEEVPLVVVVQTGTNSDAFFLDASYHADFDPHERPLRLEHLFVP